MKTYTVKSPVLDFTGVVAGVALVQGSYEGPLSLSALAYFQGAGYSVVPDEDLAAEPEPAEEPKPPFDPLPGSPARGASKADWKSFAVNGAPEGLRLTEEQAEALTRDQLAEKYLGPKEA
jgi:hypothetical protein